MADNDALFPEIPGTHIEWSYDLLRMSLDVDTVATPEHAEMFLVKSKREFVSAARQLGCLRDTTDVEGGAS